MDEKFISPTECEPSEQTFDLSYRSNYQSPKVLKWNKVSVNYSIKGPSQSSSYGKGACDSRPSMSSSSIPVSAAWWLSGLVWSLFACSLSGAKRPSSNRVNSTGAIFLQLPLSLSMITTSYARTSTCTVHKGVILPTSLSQNSSPNFLSLVSPSLKMTPRLC